MSKRTQSIRSLFAAQPEGESSPDNKQPLPRVTSGAVKSLKDTFSDVERDYQALKERIANGSTAIELQPELVDPSPFADRFEEQDEEAYQALRLSISERGQEIPILVREHPTSPGRYQSAYGHRRLRVLRDLGRPVKAYLRTLSDEELILAQGIENSAREDLSFIERAAFALKLEDGGFTRNTIQVALSVDRAEISKLIAVAKAIPADLIASIGRAPKVGRGRWQTFAELTQDAASLTQMRALAAATDFKLKATDERFRILFSAKVAPRGGDTAQAAQIAKTHTGVEIATLTRVAGQSRIHIHRGHDEAFADFVMSKLPELYGTYKGGDSDDQ